jgi:hypothetical protein
MASDRNDVAVALVADDRFSQTFASFRRQIEGAGSLATGFASRVSSFRLSMGSLGAGLTFGGAVASIRAAVNGLDALNDSADAVGDTVENLSALEDVARRNGGSLDLVTTAVLKMNQVLRDTDPNSEGARVLKQLGLDARELRNQNPTAALQEIAVALNGFENNGTRGRATLLLLGKSTRELASFLKDVAEAGTLNATVTKRQTDEAERFNKALSSMSTEAGNAGRALASALLPALNESFVRFNALRNTFGSAREGLLAGISQKNFTDAGDGVAYFTQKLKELDDERAQTLASNKRRGLGILGQGDYEKERAELQKFAQFYRAVYQATAPDLGQSDSRELARRNAGGGLPSLPELGGTPGAAANKVSEAMRYLEALQKQAEKVQELSTYEQALADIEKKRIEGITPALESQIRDQATYVDLLVESRKEVEAFAAIEKVNRAAELAATKQRADAVKNLLDDTTAAKFSRAARDVELIREQLADPANQGADFGMQAIEALEKIKASLVEVPDAAKTAFDRLADTVERTMERSTDAVLDFLTGAKTDPKSLWRAFSADVLRAFVEDPVRKAMKEVQAEIMKALTSDGASSGNVLGDLFKSAIDFVSGLAGGTPGGGRANGGRVSAGSLYRVNENGVETFRPDVPGTILSAGQTRRAAGASVNYSVVNHINGDVSSQTVALLEAAMARNNAAIRRSMRTGGAFATS